MTAGAKSIDTVHGDLVELCGLGIRFHGTSGIAAASDWLESRVTAAGATVERESVPLPGWSPGTPVVVRVITPIERALPAWPMLWSGGTAGEQRGAVVAIGPQGLWGDSMVWEKFAVVADGAVIAFLHARDGGPAAPQPLPAGSDTAVAHLSIGRLDGLQLSEWISDGAAPTVLVSADAASAPVAVGDNLIVDIAGTGDGSVLVCAHYDTFFNTVGAYDNGSGTIALLQLIEQWRSERPSPSIRCVFFTAEEWHLSGSRAYLAERSADELDAIDYVINLDGLGRSSFLEAFVGPETFQLTVDAAISSFAASTRDDLRLVSRFPPTTGTDDAAFYRAGVPTLFMTFNDLHRLHQPEDLPNREIAANIVWTVALVRQLVASLERPKRASPVGIL